MRHLLDLLSTVAHIGYPVHRYVQGIYVRYAKRILDSEHLFLTRNKSRIALLLITVVSPNPLQYCTSFAPSA